MKKSHFSLLAGLLLSFFLVVSCTPSSTLSPIPLELNYTVTFINVDSTFETSTVPFGGRVEKPSRNPYKNYNYFMYWSESKASQAAATEFNFTTPITRDITLYAIYSPWLASECIQSLTSTQIQIKLSNTSVYPLEDGSYAGLKFQYSTNDLSYQDYPLSIPSSYRDEGSDRYLTYTFPTPLTIGTTNWIKVSNYLDYQTDKKSVTPLINPKTVTFNDCGEIKATIEVESGSLLTVSKRPSNPSKSYNTFLYWSASKASKAAAVEFDYNTPITEDITLYAIYTPRITGIYSITSTQIEVELTDTAVYPLDDGSYAGLKVQYSPNNSDFQDIQISIPEDTRDYYSSRILTYSFPSSFTLDANASEHYFKVTNGDQTDVRFKIISSAAAVTDLNATTADSYAMVSFKTACTGWSYKVQAIKNGIEVASKTIAVSSRYSIGNVEFFGLENGTSYTFKVTTDGSSYYTETTATPSIPTQKKSSDWLVVMYMDGDNNLNDVIYQDMNEVEYGLYYIRNSDDTPMSSYDSVNAVALWDGVVSWTTTNDQNQNVTNKPKYGKSGSYIFELGQDSNNSTTYATSGGNVLSNKTKNLSYTASWLVPNKTPSATNDFCGEVNMGDKQTLINFLTWVNAHYTANKGVILQFSNHGAGPRSARFVQTADGRTLQIGETEGRRALCQDLSSSNSILKTKDVSDALNAAGYGPTNKAAMILMDVCLGSSLEDAYQFRNYANYLAASPNNIPGLGLDYRNLMKSFTKNTTIENIGKQIVTDYKAQYGDNTSLWNQYASLIFGQSSYSYLKDDEKKLLEWFGDLGITTFTITDLSKVADVKTAIDSLCDVLLSTTGKAKTVYVDANGYFSTTATLNTRNYVTYLGQHHANIVNIFTNTTDNYSLDDYLYYQGSYTWLYDIGYMAKMLHFFSASTIGSSANANAWPELNTAATNLVEKLDAAIKYSWRDSKLSSNKDFYTRIDGRSGQFEHYLGLTICGANIATNGENLTQGTAPSFYKTDLAFGVDSKWGDLLAYWFGTGN